MGVGNGADGCLVLASIITRAPHRRRGAGRLLVEWGLEQARRDGCPAYVEATEEGQALYEARGMRKVGRCVVPGIGGVEFARMAYNV